MKKIKLSKKQIAIKVILIILILYVFVFLFNIIKPLPEGISIEGTIYNISDEDIEFLYDLTYLNESGDKVLEQEIFKNVFSLIDNATKFIVIDMFLFNTDYTEKEPYVKLTTIIKDKLIEKKKAYPNIQIYFTTDEINNFYGSYTSDEILTLRENGINVIITDLTKLRDSNPIYSAFWRIFFRPFGTSGNGNFKHLLGNENKKVTLRSILKLINTKANHRKVIVADNNNNIYSIITSANPHEASSAHSNIAFLIKEDIWRDLIKAEQAVADFSEGKVSLRDTSFVSVEDGLKNIEVQLLTEGKIRSNLINDIDYTFKGESIDIAMFYLSDRKIINSILKASKRGVNIRLILDPNKDAFAREKNGIPNRQVAYELVEKSNDKIKIRWYNTKGEQFHTKLIIIRKQNKTIIYLGSANLTKRNIGNLNLEADVKISSPNDKKIVNEINLYFKRIWENENGNYTTPFEEYQDTSLFKYYLYRLQEFSGFSSF